MRRAGIESHLIRAKDCLSQLSFILVDEKSGERTILWKRDPRLTLMPNHLQKRWILNGRALLVDGHDAKAAAQAAKWAQSAQIPVISDVDNIYSGIEELLEYTDYLFASKEFPPRLLNKSSLLEALPLISRRYGCKVAGATLGRLGAIAWNGMPFHYCPGYGVRAVDTTGAGDVFHAGIVYGILKRWSLQEILEFSCAAAALNCAALGARGGIKSLHEIRRFMRNATRSEAAFSARQLVHYVDYQSKPRGSR